MVWLLATGGSWWYTHWTVDIVQSDWEIEGHKCTEEAQGYEFISSLSFNYFQAKINKVILEQMMSIMKFHRKWLHTTELKPRLLITKCLARIVKVLKSKSSRNAV